MYKPSRGIVKLAASVTYGTACNLVSTIAITAVVDPQTESCQDLCELGGAVVGTAIWWKTNSIPAAIIDKVADFRLSRKLAHEAAPEA